MEVTMKATDTVAMVLKHKAFNEILAISPEQTVYEALSLMAEYDVGALMVMSVSHLVVILSEHDYARKVILQGLYSKEAKVLEVMSCPAISAPPRHTENECMNMMTESHFRHLPVLEEAKVVGRISNR
jgi:CBS domain-containing protein